MAEKPKSGSFSTVYEAEDAGMLTLDRRKDIEAEVASYVAVIGQLREDFKQEPEVVEGLREIEKQRGALRISKEPEEDVRRKLAALVRETGLAVLLDDRDARPGVKFADAELIGIPHRLVISDRSLAAGELEYRHRRDSQARNVKREQALELLKEHDVSS